MNKTRTYRTRTRKDRGVSPAAKRLIAAAAVFLTVVCLKAAFPAGLLDALSKSINTGAPVRDILTSLGRSASSTDVFKILWEDGVLRVFGIIPDTEAAMGNDADIVTDAPEDGGKSTLSDEATGSPSTLDTVDFSLADAQVDIDVGELPPAGDSFEVVNFSGISEIDGHKVPENVSVANVSIPVEYTTPVHGKITSPFGYRDHPIDGEYKFHYGIDISGKKGDPIRAFADGEVIYAGSSEINGKYVKIEHDCGLVTLYAHLSKMKVKLGQKVKLGDVIGLVGETGEANGPHLHFQIYSGGKLINPIYFIEYEV